MGLSLEYFNGQTPIEEEEKEELKIKTISTRGELDEFEQANIEKAVEWSIKRSFTYDKILTTEFIKEVHRRMFYEVWGWAGKFKLTTLKEGGFGFQTFADFLEDPGERVVVLRHDVVGWTVLTG